MAKSNQNCNHAESSMVQERLRGAGEQLAMAATSVKDTAMECGNHFVAEPARDLIGLLKDYAKTRPEVAAAWCFGIGLFLGWKLRP